jgi:hypothetical protein
MSVPSGTKVLSVRVLDYCPPTGERQSIGVLAYCAATDSLHVIFRDIDITDPFDREYLQALSAYITTLSADLGPAKLFTTLDESLSNLLRISYAEDHVEAAENDIDAILSEILQRRVQEA